MITKTPKNAWEIAKPNWQSKVKNVEAIRQTILLIIFVLNCHILFICLTVYHIVYEILKFKMWNNNYFKINM